MTDTPETDALDLSLQGKDALEVGKAMRVLARRLEQQRDAARAERDRAVKLLRQVHPFLERHSDTEAISAFLAEIKQP
jgi:hypothetical protein